MLYAKNYLYGVTLTLCATLAACGGGGGDSDSLDEVAGANVAVSNELQAKKSVARVGIGATEFAELNLAVAIQAAQSLNGATSPSGTRNCSSGTGSMAYVFKDSDGNGLVSASDALTLTFTNCRIGDYEPMSGQTTLQIEAANNIADFLGSNGAGKLAVSLSYTHFTQPSTGLALAGIYTTSLERSSQGGPLKVVGGFKNLTATANGVSATFNDLQIVGAINGNSITTADVSGHVSTNVDGLGLVAYDISTVKGGDGDLTGAQIRLASSGHTLLVTFDTADSLEVKVDNGNNGSFEYDISTTVEELQSLFPVL